LLVKYRRKEVAHWNAKRPGHQFNVVQGRIPAQPLYVCNESPMEPAFERQRFL